jgi:transposase InsO family protein
MRWFGSKKRKYIRRNPISTKRNYEVSEKLRLIKEYEASGAPMSRFCEWYGICDGSLKGWIEKYRTEGEAGLVNKFRGSRKEIPEAVKEEIVKLKEENPSMGVKKISDYLARNKFVKIYRAKVMEILKSNPRTAELIALPATMRGHSDKEPVSFERSKPREMYQMDIMTFRLKGLYNLYVIGCLDDYSRYVVSFGLFRQQTSEHAIEVLKSAIEQFGTPVEVLTDNGRQFYTWRGKSAFQKYVIKSGIQHIRSRPYHPQTLGKIESLWRNMYQELFSKVALGSFEEAEEKMKGWINYYNNKRPHQGIGGLAPADRFFGVENAMREVMEKGAGMVKDSLVLDPRRLKAPMYFVGNIGGKEIKIIAREGSVEVKGVEEVKKLELKEEEKGVELGTGGEKNGGQGENDGRTDSNIGGAESVSGNSRVGSGENPDRSEIRKDIEDTDERGRDAGSERGTGSEPGEFKAMEEQGSNGDEESAHGGSSGKEARGLGGGEEVKGGTGENPSSDEKDGERKSEIRAEDKAGYGKPADGEACAGSVEK